jgi:hypothetical protein
VIFFVIMAWQRWNSLTPADGQGRCRLERPRVANLPWIYSGISERGTLGRQRSTAYLSRG